MKIIKYKKHKYRGKKPVNKIYAVLLASVMGFSSPLMVLADDSGNPVTEEEPECE
ncbi:MAG: hypothetical protein KZQ58_06735 [gamma proteobacterium symbiont of Bathyaustriella thionipta]|nr:hypothetical protein [gamma proteobacterium symbiont of Bathyaustriella thionipta]